MNTHNYKMALLLFTNPSNELPGMLSLLETLVAEENFGTIKDVQVLGRDQSLIGPVLEDYKNTNLGMIVLLSPNADEFFPYSELEEVGKKNEKFLVTLNLDQNLKANFLKVMQKVKASPGKRYRGCDASCR